MNTYKKLNQYTTKLIITGNKNNGTVLIDTEDVALLKNHSWYIANPTFVYKKDSTKCTSDLKYVRAKIKGKTVRLHRFILKVNSKQIVDHIDRNTLNNKKSNLRLTTPSNNGLNCKISKNNISGYNGVYISKGKYIAQIKINYKTYSKTFSINKWGDRTAKYKAVKARKSLESKFRV